jgi:hypothetical protein
MVFGPRHAPLSVSILYITATASERIIDTLDFFPHNSPMLQMSSKDRIIMAAQDMKDAPKDPHRDILFATIRDDTISALATLAYIFTRKLKKGTPKTFNQHRKKLHPSNNLHHKHSQ